MTDDVDAREQAARHRAGVLGLVLVRLFGGKWMITDERRHLVAGYGGMTMDEVEQYLEITSPE